jgi:aspartyl-tRNA(Asn)/glutamyl-tRNA(Gln) amidotransferase subunit A
VPNSLTTLSACELRDLLASRTVSSVEVCAAFLDRIAAVDPDVGAFLAVSRPDVLAQAEAVDRKRQKGERVGRLAGLPVAVKDMIVTRGLQTTCGSRILKGFVPPYDAHVVERIRQEDGIVLGKTNLDEFAFGSSNENSAFKPCRNPWSLEHVPGGSSGGSAAAVVAGMAPLALGTDTGGSVRQPASLSGVVGVKPTYGRVSRYGVVAFASSLDQCGPMAMTTRDAAMLLSVIAGPDPRDATCAPTPAPDFEATLGRDIRGLRIGVPREYFGAPDLPVDAEVASTVRAALARLEGLGACIQEVGLPHSQHAIPVYYVVAVAEASSNLARFDTLRYGPRLPASGDDVSSFYLHARGRLLGTEAKRRIILGTFALSAGYYDAYYAKAMKVRTLIRKDFEDAFARCDLLAAPASPVPGFRLGQCVDDPLTMYQMDILTVPANLANIAGMSVPAGFSASGLPIGLQLLAPPFAEERMLQAAYAFEAVSGVAGARPPDPMPRSASGRQEAP